MKFIHLSDLHLGKRVNGFPMIDDQRYILDRITEIIAEEKPGAVLISGDVYDKPVPPAEAVQLFDDFISTLGEMRTEVFIISGNHDSAERLSFGSRIMDKRGIHFAGAYDGHIRKVRLEDEHGPVNIYMLPFIKPLHVRAAFPDDEDAQGITDYTGAVEYALGMAEADYSERNVLMAHQFVTGAERSESEELSVGGLDNVDARAFDRFDYTALGHIHRPQDIIKDMIRYCGTPLKYSFSEAGHEKSVTVVELGPKGKVKVRTAALGPLHDMRVLRGSFRELCDAASRTDDYMRIILTDEEEILGALPDLRAVYPNMMRLEYDNSRTRAASIEPDGSDTDSRTPLEIFAGLYEAQNGRPMDEEQTGLISELIEKVWREER